ncbi:NAD+ synthase [Parachlamydia sp. AcF125]|uniref:NAD+ synthase n=1 Tax=Parachlamydia sp. AcF125 TaxID=2795736 RepID=UPI001BC8FAE3|nr:NAD+ synthase [Parachlamydia sp. AcF125]MBS4168048.1 Glutamine-dependent NAD(+) synthetase [Parachlamydia sp. AcF125]
MRVLLAQINPIIGDLEGNTQQILAALEKGKQNQVDLIVFPELALTGYPPEDLLLLPHFMEEIEKHLQQIVAQSQNIALIVGTPRLNPHILEKKLYNSAAIIQNQQILGFQDKHLLPTYDVFDERRYFEPGEQIRVWPLCGKNVAITICEDMWQHSHLLKFTHYRHDPIKSLIPLSPDLLINLSASPFCVGQLRDRFVTLSKAAMTLQCPALLCNQVGGNDSLIFDGHSCLIDEMGRLCSLAKGFKEEMHIVDLSQPLAEIEWMESPLENLYSALVIGVRDYFHKSGFTRACLGLSGGIDSALVACIAAEALGRENVLGVAMPSRYSSPESLLDAQQLAKNLKIELWTIPIEAPFQSYLELLNPFFLNKPADITEENLQARIRGMILMGLSNKHGYIVLSTGNKSELAVGYSTLYGDMCGGLGVITDLCKQEVYALSQWINRDQEVIPWSTLHKPPSAELRPSQKDSDSLPSYEILDAILKGYVEEHQTAQWIAEKHHIPLSLVEEIIHKIHQNEYKRRQSPPGLRVTEKAFTIGRKFPIVQRWA